MIFFEEASIRLKSVVGVRFDKDVAELLGLTKRAWIGRKNKNEFPIDELYALTAKRPELGIDADYVLTGERKAQSASVMQVSDIDSYEPAGAQRLTAALSDVLTELGQHVGMSDDALMQVREMARDKDPHWRDYLKDLVEPRKHITEFVLVPKHDITASAGDGCMISDETIVDYLAFKRAWIRGMLGLDPSHVALINVRGDSMSPTIDNDDLILLDTRKNQSFSDGVYVLTLRGNLLVKRLHFAGDGLEVISDNKIYKTETISLNELERNIIVGRVVWHGRKF